MYGSDFGGEEYKEIVLTGHAPKLVYPYIDAEEK